MCVKKSLTEKFYTYCVRHGWSVVYRLIRKFRELLGYEYCISYHNYIGYCIDSYPRSLEEAECYQSLYKEYYHYKEVEIFESKHLI